MELRGERRAGLGLGVLEEGVGRSFNRESKPKISIVLMRSNWKMDEDNNNLFEDDGSTRCGGATYEVMDIKFDCEENKFDGFYARNGRQQTTKKKSPMKGKKVEKHNYKSKWQNIIGTYGKTMKNKGTSNGWM
ncbi:hypothetical protein ACH5RR_018344 [Cinchona calisaya]|uniref:Uncharacterized protein n=1 Tax=Cinchona calisaya TaxID=153742 RepID=A0ABD2ZPA8_9GENT